MGDIGKSGFPADFCNTSIGLQKLSLGIHDPGHIQVLDNRGVRVLFKFPAKIIGTEIKGLRKLFKTDIFVKIRMDKMDYLTDPVQFFYSFRLFQFSGGSQQKTIQLDCHIFI